MTTLNFLGGATPSVSVSFTDRWVSTASGVALPTGARIAANGKRPVYVATAGCYWAGNGGSRRLKLSIGGKSTTYRTVASDSSANSSGQLAIGAVFVNGGTQSVRIDSEAGSFYFGRASGTGSVDSYGTSFGRLSGSLVYYEVPVAPTSVTVTQAGLKDAVNVEWTAPADNGGSAVTSYTLQWSYKSNFTGATTIITGSSATSYKITNLAYGSTVYVRVAAVNIVATKAGTTSVFSTAGVGYVIPPNLPLNGWANFGSHGHSTFQLTHTVIKALVPETGLQRKATSTSATGNYAIGNFGIEKTYTDLIVGRSYVLTGKAILLIASPPGNIYRFAVNGIGNGSSVTLTSTTVGATIPAYTFTATSTTHTVQIQLAESVNAIVGVMEHVAFYDYAITRTATDLAYRLQDNMVNKTLLKHFDLATQSVGAAWWVDKNNVTQFAQDFDSVAPSCVFSDILEDGNIYFNNIGVSFDTSALVNQIIFENYGKRKALQGGGGFEGYTVTWVDGDNTSVEEWGARQFELETNLYTPPIARNKFTHPSFEDYEYEDEATTFRTSVEEPGQNSTPFTALQGDNVLRAYSTTSTGTIVTITNQERMRVTAGTTYNAIMYAATHATPNTRARIQIKWYNEAGTEISTYFGSYVSLSSNRTWYKITGNATAPAGANTARIAGYFTQTTGAVFGAGAKQFIDGVYFGIGSTSDWFDGNTQDTKTVLHEWDSAVNNSSSAKYTNILDTRTQELLAQFSTPKIVIGSLRWNTAQNPVLAATLDIGSIVTITFRETTNNYRIVGIIHEATPDTWNMTIQVAKEN